MIFKFRIGLAILVALAVLCGSACGEYELDTACRELKEIQNDENVSAKLKLALSTYLNTPEVRTKIVGRVSTVFELDYFSTSFEPIISPIISEFDISSQNFSLLIYTDSNFEPIKEPYTILEVGLYHSRTYLLFTNENQIPNDRGVIAPIVLGENSRLKCTL